MSPARAAVPVAAADPLRDPDTVAEADLDRLEAALGGPFRDRTVLMRALAHRSWCAEHGVEQSNERLEFLGDSVLGLAVTHYVYNHFPRLPEGQLSEVRAGVEIGRAHV